MLSSLDRQVLTPRSKEAAVPTHLAVPADTGGRYSYERSAPQSRPAAQSLRLPACAELSGGFTLALGERRQRQVKSLVKGSIGRACALMK